MTLLFCAAMLLTPSAASAHSGLLRTEPGDGTALTAPPDRISLVFNEPVWTDYATVAVTDSGGRQLTTGSPQVIETTLSVPLQGAETGEYHVTWRVVSADGHPITGQFSFTVAGSGAAAQQPTAASSAAAPGSPAGQVASPEGGAGTAAATTPPVFEPAPPEEGENWWIIGVLVAALVALGGAVLLYRRRNRR
ncbi:hypothetical protein UG55_103238 [Frankia sp. EI5c]|nr:hypothetical protein UG55_103238 [Frankia sp. EI5c]